MVKWLMRAGVFAALLVQMGTAQAQSLSSNQRTFVFMQTMIIRGAECALLNRWQQGVLKTQLLEIVRGWSGQEYEAARAATNERLAQTPCDDPGLTEWIQASQKGFESEMLAPYLVIYRTLAAMETPPRVFNVTALRLDFKPAILAVDAKLAQLAANDALAEGGKSWPQYIEGLQEQVLEFASRLNGNAGSDGPNQDQIASYFAQAALIVEIWLSETGAGP